MSPYEQRCQVPKIQISEIEEQYRSLIDDMQSHATPKTLVAY